MHTHTHAHIHLHTEWREPLKEGSYNLHLLTRARFTQYSTSIPLCLVSQVLEPDKGRTEPPGRLLHVPVSHDHGCEERLFLSMLYIKLSF